MYSKYGNKKNQKRRKLKRSFVVFICLIIIVTVLVLAIKYHSDSQSTEIKITNYNLSDLINQTNNCYLKYNFADYYVKNES